MSQTIASKIDARIHGNGRGYVFSQSDFADLAGATTINSAFRRLVLAGTIRRIFDGIYDYPRYSELLRETLLPPAEGVAQALARKFGWVIWHNGATALNLMNLSTQVPAQHIYLSDGPSRQYAYDNIKLQFKHVAAKDMRFKYFESAVLVHGIKTLGPKQVNTEVIRKMRVWLPEQQRSKILRDTQAVTAWIRDTIQLICSEE